MALIQVYAPIVGSCAFASGGCPITQRESRLLYVARKLTAYTELHRLLLRKHLCHQLYRFSYVRRLSLSFSP